MTRRRKSPPKPLAVCARCGALIPEQKPIFLVTTVAGRIVGPYHAGCAWKAHDALKRQGLTPETDAAEYGREVWSSREETMPW